MREAMKGMAGIVVIAVIVVMEDIKDTMEGTMTLKEEMAVKQLQEKVTENHQKKAMKVRLPLASI
jgi:hypothetical protein